MCATTNRYAPQRSVLFPLQVKSLRVHETVQIWLYSYKIPEKYCYCGAYPYEDCLPFQSRLVYAYCLGHKRRTRGRHQSSWFSIPTSWSRNYSTMLVNMILTKTMHKYTITIQNTDRCWCWCGHILTVDAFPQTAVNLEAGSDFDHQYLHIFNLHVCHIYSCTF